MRASLFQTPPPVGTWPLAAAVHNLHTARHACKATCILPERVACDEWDSFLETRFLVGEGEFGSCLNILLCDKNVQWEEGGRTHYRDTNTIVAWPAAVVYDLEPTRSRIIGRPETR